MTSTDAPLPPRLAEIVDLFAMAEGHDKLQLLADFANELPPLPERLRGGAWEPIEECMTPVHVLAECEGDGVVYHFDIPPESPTVRGFASLLARGLSGESPAAIVAVPDAFYENLGLTELLTHRRMEGISAILRRMKRLAVKCAAQNGSARTTDAGARATPEGDATLAVTEVEPAAP